MGVGKFGSLVRCFSNEVGYGGGEISIKSDVSNIAGKGFSDDVVIRRVGVDFKTNTVWYGKYLRKVDGDGVMGLERAGKIQDSCLFERFRYDYFNEEVESSIVDG